MIDSIYKIIIFILSILQLDYVIVEGGNEEYTTGLYVYVYSNIYKLYYGNNLNKFFKKNC